MIRRFVRALTPPVVVTLYRRGRAKLGLSAHWEGRYPDFGSARRAGEYYDSDWANTAIARTKGTLQTRDPSVPVPLAGHDTILPALASIVRHDRRGPVRILDYGGGVGIAFARILASIPDSEGIEHHVIELPWARTSGPTLFHNAEAIHFHQSIPSDLTDIDIVMLDGVLQHLADYAAVLKQVLALRPRYVLVGDLYAGAFATCASSWVQDRDTATPHWFFNLQDVVSLIESAGWELIFAASQPPPTDTGEIHRFTIEGVHCCSLLFARR